LIFPITRFARVNSIQDQCAHVLTEAQEAFDEQDPHLKAMELYDNIHSSETGLEILRVVFGVDLEKAKADVIAKNLKRGYYN